MLCKDEMVGVTFLDYDRDYIYLSRYESSNRPGNMAVESLHPPRVLTNLVLIL